MRIGIVGPSSIDNLKEVNKDAELIIESIAGILWKHDIVLTPNKGSVSEYFVGYYRKSKGRKNVYIIVPMQDKEFGISWVNTEIGKTIDCGTWRNQPEKLNEESDALLVLGYSVGGLAEIAYSKWFRKKTVYVIKELVSEELPKDSVRDLDIKYISYKDVELIFKNAK